MTDVKRRQERPVPVRIGYSADFAPFTYTKRRRAAGQLIDAVKYAFAQSHFRPRFIELPETDVIARLTDHSIEAFAVIAVTAVRRRHFGFSRPLATTGGAWFVLREHAPSANNGPEGSACIATPAYGPLVSVIQKRFRRLSIMATPDYHSALAAVVSGAATAAALNLDVGRIQAQRDFPGGFRLPEKTFCRLPLALAYLKRNPPTFIRPFNTAIRELHK